MIPSLAELLADVALPVRLLSGAAFLAVLVALSVIDLRTRRLPSAIVLPTLWAGLVLNAGHVFTTPEDAILGAVAGYGSLWLLGAAYSVRRPAAFGGGDLKLCAMIGAWFGVQAVPATLLVAFVAGTCAVLPLLMARRCRLTQAVPFGPALSLGGAVVLLAGSSFALRVFSGDWW